MHREKQRQSVSNPLLPLFLCALCVLCGELPAFAEEPEQPAAEEKIPPAPTHYKGRRIATTMHWLGAEWLVRQTREREERTSLLLKNLGIKPGDTVCDLGAGNGYYTLKMARLVGEKGKVIANDIQPEMLEMLKKRAAHAELENIVTIKGSIIDAKVPAGSCDLILLVDVYHEFSHPEQMLASIRKALKPRGRVALVEYRAEDPEVPIKKLHKMSKEQIMKEWPPNGFKLESSYDELPWQHVMFFQRDDAPPEEDDEIDAAPKND